MGRQLSGPARILGVHSSEGVRQEVPTRPHGCAPVHHTRSVRTKPGGGQAGRGRRSAPGAGASLFSKGRNKTASSPRRRPIPEVPRPGPSGRAVSVSTLPPCGEPRCSLPRRASRAPVPSLPVPGRVAQVLAQGVPGGEGQPIPEKPHDGFPSPPLGALVCSGARPFQSSPPPMSCVCLCTVTPSE